MTLAYYITVRRVVENKIKQKQLALSAEPVGPMKKMGEEAQMGSQVFEITEILRVSMS